MYSESISYEAYIRSRHVRNDPYQYILNHLQAEQRLVKKGDLIIFTRYNDYDSDVPVMLASGTYLRDVVGGYFEAEWLGRVDTYPKTALIAVVNRPKRYMRRFKMAKSKQQTIRNPSTRVKIGSKEYYYDFNVHGRPEEKGKRVVVFKGRKYPIGQEFTIRGFWTDDYGKTYMFSTNGDKIDINNVYLKIPVKREHAITEYVITKNPQFGSDMMCPICKSTITKRDYKGLSFDPGWDLYFENYECHQCGQYLKGQTR